MKYPKSSIDEIYLQKIFSKIPNSLLITAQKNYGIADVLLETIDVKLFDISIINPTLKDSEDFEKGSIGVEEVRNLQEISSRMHKRPHFIILTKADSMTRPAQNAFLKLLEEPGSNTFFILCSESPNKLLSTITSRVQSYSLHNISKSQSIEYVKSLGIKDASKINQIVYLADGLPRLLKQLSTDEGYFEEKSSDFKISMVLLAAKPYQKIIELSKFKDDRDKALELLDDLLLILKNTISSKPEYSSLDKIDRLIKCKDRIHSGGNVRLNLIAAML